MKLSIFRKPRQVSDFENDIAEIVYSKEAGFFDYILGRFSPNVPQEDMQKVPKWATDSGLVWNEVKGRYELSRRISMDWTDS